VIFFFIVARKFNNFFNLNGLKRLDKYKYRIRLHKVLKGGNIMNQLSLNNIFKLTFMKGDVTS